MTRERAKARAATIEELNRAAKAIDVRRFDSPQEFIADLYEELKSALTVYSYNQYTKDLGLGTGITAFLIVKSKRTLTPKTAEKIAKNLFSDDHDRFYFLALVRSRYGKTQQDQEAALDEVLRLKSRFLRRTPARLELEFFQHWLPAILFELVGLPDFKSDTHWISKRLIPCVTFSEIQEGIKLLEDLGLLRFDPVAGRHHKTREDFQTSSEVPGSGIVRFHQRMIDLGKESLTSCEPDDRDISSVTLRLPMRLMPRIKSDIQLFRRYLAFLASTSEEGDEVVQANIQIFPLTRRKAET